MVTTSSPRLNSESATYYIDCWGKLDSTSHSFFIICSLILVTTSSSRLNPVSATYYILLEKTNNTSHSFFIRCVIIYSLTMAITSSSRWNALSFSYCRRGKSNNIYIQFYLSMSHCRFYLVRNSIQES